LKNNGGLFSRILESKGRNIMVSKEKLDRINELARKSKVTELTQEEKEEQQALRSEYIANFREVFRGQLEQIKFVDEDGIVETDKDMN